MSYSLELSDTERARYRLMASGAAANEQLEWDAAGITAGARVADVGCGPGAVLRLLAERVGASGAAHGVDGDPGAVAVAQEEVQEFAQATARAGQANDTGLEPESYDVVMCRHVLAHNGGKEGSIVDHLAGLAAPGGCVYLVDVDITALRITYEDPDLLDLLQRYGDFHRARGNDLSVGMRLGDLLTGAGLALERYACRAPVMPAPPGMRPPAWAARDQLVADGIATPADVDRWGRAFATLDGQTVRPWIFPASFVAIGRRVRS